MTLKTLNILIKHYNERIMLENEFTAVYKKVQPSIVDIIRLIYTAKWRILGDNAMKDLSIQCDKIIKRIA